MQSLRTSLSALPRASTSRLISPRSAAIPRSSPLASRSLSTPTAPLRRPENPYTSFHSRHAEHQRQIYAKRNRSLLLYSSATIILVGGLSYAAVPLYRVFCSATGYGGTPITDAAKFSADRLTPFEGSERRITVQFNADASDSLPWSFEPQQKEVKVLPGETALAFYTATNNSDEDIIGIATYNVTPNQIAPYFAKVECFCFEEQRILAGEEVDLPVFFFIDRDFMEDPLMRDVYEVTLSYTFFRARRDDYGNLVPAESPISGMNPVKTAKRPVLPSPVTAEVPLLA